MPQSASARTARQEVSLVVDPTKAYDRRIVRGAATYAKENELECSLYIQEDPVDRLPNLENWKGDGIVANFDSRRVADALRDAGIPTVAIGGGYGYISEKSTIAYVRTDNKAIAELAANHFLNLGIRNFAFYCPRPNGINGWATERLHYYRAFLETLGYPCICYTARYSAPRRWVGYRQEIQSWVRSLPKQIGLMAANDMHAMHVIRAARELGVRIPEDIAILGVHNDDIICELSRPKLTSVEHATKRIGYEAAAVLDRLMNGKNANQVVAIPPEGLIERESTEILAVDEEDVAKALQFIRVHACDPITARDVLDLAQVSRSALEARFREVLGRSIYAEIRRVQIEKAKVMLTTTSVPIKEIVHAVGASSVQYFTAMIREATGQTPGQIRSDALGQ